MPNTPHGDTDYIFGIDSGFDTVDGVKLESLNIDGAPEFEAFAKDRTGKVVSHVVGADKQTFTASGFRTSGSLAEIGDMFTLDSYKFIINRISVTESNTEFEKVEIGGQAFKLVTT